MIGEDPTISVTEFVELFNETVQMTYPFVSIKGELANFKISKNRWVYFDLKDEMSSVKFFGSVNMLPGPLDNGISVKVLGYPRLHNLYGFSINAESIVVVGKGSIEKAKLMLAKKLEAEGLFAIERKRQIKYPPEKLGVVASLESAGYADFIKIINQRWGNVEVFVADTLVQGDEAPAMIVRAINSLNMLGDPLDTLAIIRGGGSADDLAAFSNEKVVRAVASSRIPTVVAIGHEVDVSLAELASDLHASTPSNAAELLVPDKNSEILSLKQTKKYIGNSLDRVFARENDYLNDNKNQITNIMNTFIDQENRVLHQKKAIVSLLDPKKPLEKGYAIVRDESKKHIKSIKDINKNAKINIELKDGIIDVTSGGKSEQ